MELRQVFRQERKFLLDAPRRLTLERRLADVLQPDKHNGSTGYLVRSLYFDTPDNQDFHDKLSGTECRRKLRLRVYSPHADTVFLEMKQKQGFGQLKRSLPLKRSDAAQLLQGNYAPLLGYSTDFAAECYGLLHSCVYRPKVLVEYRRSAYVLPENSTRITLDSALCATPFWDKFFDPSPGFAPILNPSETVLEVKFNHFLLSYAKNLLADCERSETSVSKYVLARQQKLLF
ncbi:MAG: polyphosphate polymerase domain-containing protein [Oscillospiraceae bacterium]